MYLVLDSGAFTAWTKGELIDLDDYIQFIKDNSDYIDAYINLDVIPGSPNVIPTAQDVETSAFRSWQNLLHMEGAGLNPIPVFHQGEQFKWLRKMVEHGCAYVGISPANDRSTKAKIVWLDRVFTALCDADGVPCVKTHSFGATSTEIIFRYPWHSIDSTTWLKTGSKYGMLLVPRADPRTGAWEVRKRISRVFVSKESNPRRIGHFTSLSLTERQHLERWVKECGFTMQEVFESFRARDLCNISFFKLLSTFDLPKRFTHQRPFLFEED